MIDKLKKILALVDADYADLRYDVKKETVIGFNGKELTKVSADSADGYVLRVLWKGGFSCTTFIRPSDSGKAIESALADAKLLSGNTKRPAALAKVPAIKAEFRPDLSEPAGKISLDEKIGVFRGYNAIPLKSGRVVSTNLVYNETFRQKYFVSTEGAEICEELETLSFAGSATAKDGSNNQSVLFLIGGSDGFGRMRRREEYFEKTTGTLVDLLSAGEALGRNHNVILDPDLSATFVHESFGHYSEADLVEDVPGLREKMRLGAELGSGMLNICDDPTIPRQLGFYKYDDEGVPARRVQLMKNGVLTGRLHSRRTAAAFGEGPTGHCVAEDYRYQPIVRMGTIMIEPDPSMSFAAMLEKLGDGLYLCGTNGGQTSGENFTFDSAWGYEVKNGRLGRMLKGMNIMGNLFATLKSITAVGNDTVLGEYGGCGKGQLNRRSCCGGPHLLINNALIGGKK